MTAETCGARVRLNDRWGYIDEKGNEIVLCKYDAWSFSEGLACAENPGCQWFYFDSTGKQVEKMYNV
jgi:hypothetical protein